MLLRDELLGACDTDEITWSNEQKEGEKAGALSEEAAVSAALSRAFRAVDEEVIGSVCPCRKLFSNFVCAD